MIKTVVSPLRNPSEITLFETQCQEAGQIIIHLLLYAKKTNFEANVQSNIYLQETISGRRSRLHTAINLRVDEDIQINVGNSVRALLIFQGLSKDCTSFSIYEPVTGRRTPFECKLIHRNERDVYKLFSIDKGPLFIK